MNKKPQESRPDSAERDVPVWDLGVRFFHWALLILVVTSFVTIKVGGAAFKYHMWSGYAILALLMFRIVWGFVGGTHARFTSFVRGPGAVIAALKSMFDFLCRVRAVRQYRQAAGTTAHPVTTARRDSGQLQCGRSADHVTALSFPAGGPGRRGPRKLAGAAGGHARFLNANRPRPRAGATRYGRTTARWFRCVPPRRRRVTRIPHAPGA